MVGGSNSGFAGIVDEFRVGIIIPRDPYMLTSGAAFDLMGAGQDGRLVIQFDEEGRLAGTKPVRFGIASRTAREDFVIGLGGNVDRWSSTPEKKDAPKKTDEPSVKD